LIKLYSVKRNCGNDVPPPYCNIYCYVYVYIYRVSQEERT
jgi:hypothetical protein